MSTLGLCVCLYVCLSHYVASQPINSCEYTLSHFTGILTITSLIGCRLLNLCLNTCSLVFVIQFSVITI